MAGKTTIDILSLAKELTADHLEVVRTEIERVRKELHGLESMEKFIDAQINGPKQRQKPGKKPVPKPAGKDDDDDDGAAKASDRQKEIAVLLLSGKMRVAQIADKIKSSVPPVYGWINHEWFEKNAVGEVGLTNVGRAAAIAAK